MSSGLVLLNIQPVAILELKSSYSKNKLSSIFSIIQLLFLKNWAMLHIVRIDSSVLLILGMSFMILFQKALCNFQNTVCSCLFQNAITTLPLFQKVILQPVTTLLCPVATLSFFQHFLTVPVSSPYLPKQSLMWKHHPFDL